MREVADGTKNADSAGLNRIRVSPWHAPFIRKHLVIERCLLSAASATTEGAAGAVPAFEAESHVPTALRAMLEDVESVEDVKIAEMGLILKAPKVPTRLHKRTANTVNVKTQSYA